MEGCVGGRTSPERLCSEVTTSAINIVSLSIQCDVRSFIGTKVLITSCKQFIYGDPRNVTEICELCKLFVVRPLAGVVLLTYIYYAHKCTFEGSLCVLIKDLH